MFADKGYEGWDKLSAYQKVKRMMEIHKSGHEGEDVSTPTLFTLIFVFGFVFCMYSGYLGYILAKRRDDK